MEIRVVAYYGDIHVYSFKATESRNERQLIPNPNPIRKDVRKGKDRNHFQNISCLAYTPIHHFPRQINVIKNDIVFIDIAEHAEHASKSMVIMSIPRLSELSFRKKQESVMPSGAKVMDLVERRFRNHFDCEYSARVNVRSRDPEELELNSLSRTWHSFSENLTRDLSRYFILYNLV